MDVISCYPLHTQGRENKLVVSSYGFLTPQTKRIFDLDQLHLLK